MRGLIAFGAPGAVILLAILLAGCRAIGAPGSLVDYHRSGGIAGLDDHLVIDANGRATLTRRNQSSQFTLAPDRLQQLQALLSNSDFSKLHGDYLPTHPGNDFLDYQLSANGQTVHTQDTAMPNAVQPVLNFLNRVVDSNGQP